MSGHSKFANIKHKKEKNDAAKGKTFTMIGREIAIAVKIRRTIPSCGTLSQRQKPIICQTIRLTAELKKQLAIRAMSTMKSLLTKAMDQEARRSLWTR